MPRRLFSAAATGLLLLSLAACGEGGDGPVTTPPPSIDIGGSSDGGGESDGGGDPTEAAPDVLAPDPTDFAGMDENTPEGAEQAFRYYIAVSMWAHQSGDSSLLTDLQSDDCGGCSDFMETFDELTEHGELWSEFQLADTGVDSYESENFDVEVTYDFTTTPHTRPKDDFSERVDVGELQYLTAGGLDWDGDRWVVKALNAEWGDDVFSD